MLLNIAASWVGVFLSVLVFPKFINASNEERYKILQPLSLTMRIVGTALIAVSVLIIQGIIPLPNGM